MATSPFNRNRLFDGGTSFFGGMNSFMHPEELPSNQYSWSINTQVVGGDIVTRSDYISRMRFPDGKAQGGITFVPANGIPVIVVAVSGVIYYSQFPFEDYSRIANIEFDSSVDHIVFEEATVAVDESGNAISPYPVLILQDGVTRAAYWDGSFSRHLQPGGTTLETPVGLWMQWVGGRLWVARGNQLFASDLYNPLKFVDQTYIAGGSSLQAIDGKTITALKRTADNKSLLVFTIQNTTIVKAGITDRTQWPNTVDFVSLLFPGVGATSGKALVEVNGILWWWSLEGVRNFTQVASTLQTSNNAVSSEEMKRSYDNISPNLNRVCAFAFREKVGFSVPSGDIYNRHTWVCDLSVGNLLSGSFPKAWQSVWMGTRPVEWITGVFNGKYRCFHLSQDYCGVRLWESFAGETGKDNEGAIYTSTELNGNKFNEEVSLKRYIYTRYFMTGISGTVDVTSEYRGEWGCWKENASLSFCAENCISDLCASPLASMTPQNRILTTQEAKPTSEACEGGFDDSIGSSFQGRIRWYGKAGLRKYKATSDQYQERSSGECQPSDSSCKILACCDPELTYISSVDDGYGYASNSSTPSCSL